MGGKELKKELEIGKYKVIPVIQAGMSVRIAGKDLVTAVTECDGIGTFGGVGRGYGLEKYQNLPIYEADRQALRDDLIEAREKDKNGVFAVNILWAVKDREELVRTAVNNGANIIVVGAGLPNNLPELTSDHPEVALVLIVSSLQAFNIICLKWWKKYKRLPDAVIVEEPNTAGGHLGAKFENVYKENLKLKNVIPEIKKYIENNNLNIPIIAAGGIWDRDDIDSVLGYGANGVQMATRFVTTKECDAPIQFKEKYINCEKEDIVLIKSPVGYPGRIIRTKFSDNIKNEKFLYKPDINCFNCLGRCSFMETKKDFCIMDALNTTYQGDVENGIVFAGSNAYRSKEQGIISVREVFDELGVYLPKRYDIK
jgi:nitronate monooxygenase